MQKNIKKSGEFFLSLLLSFLYYTTVLSNHFISFIVPCFNCQKTVKESIDSIYDQNIQYPFEVICTDDASTDGTLALLREYEKKYNNFHVYVHEVNRGGGAASNTCVKFSQGDLLFRLDSDNILSENTIDRLVRLLDESGSDGASVQELRFFQGDKVAYGSWFYRPENNICDLGHAISEIANPSHSGNYLFTKKSFEKAGGYPEDHGSDTFRFGFKQYATGSKIAILPGTFYWHRDSQENSYWRKEEAKGTNKIKALETLLEYKEVFSPESRDALKKLRKTPQKVFDYVEKKMLKLVSNNCLEELFLGYELKQRGMFDESLNHFEKAKKLGCHSKKIDKMILNLKNMIN